jgi:pimeloyl-ACP methyl ester carboxylesterase
METHPALRPFRVDVPEEDLDDLRRRIASARWPSKELVEDRSQGVQLATMQELARYWQTDYDWGKAEEKLNALPQFTTEIDGVDIHFIHVRSQHADAMPLIMTHGWPGSVIELLDTVGPLTDPTAHGGQAEDAFHLVLPSLPGYGFSGEPADLGWNVGRVAQAWAELMDRLGYTRYVAQGGDLRVAHFVGLHGLQALPLFGYLLALLAPEWLRMRHRVALVWMAGVSYLCLIGLLTWQALRGQPVISPDARTLGAFLALLLAAGTAVFAVVLQARRGRRR